MRGLWLESGRLQFRDDLNDPDPGPGEALIRVRLAGICGTDLELVKGYYPFSGIPGHEFVGQVVTASDAALQGRRVVGEINAVCGSCFYCRTGRRSHCTSRSVLGIVNRNGAFADFLVLPEENLHLVPDSVSDRQAVFTEPLAAALQILEQVPIEPEHRVLLIGAGRLGLLIAQVLARRSCKFAAAAKHPSQVALLSGWGVGLKTSDTVTREWDVVVEATGSPSGLQTALEAVRPRGTVVLKSTYHGNASVALSEVVVNEVTLVGSRCGPFEPALRLLAGGDIQTEPMISGTFPLQLGQEAFSRAGRPGALKYLVDTSSKLDGNKLEG